MSRTGRKWKLKRSDAKKERPDGGLAVISRRRKKPHIVSAPSGYSPRTNTGNRPQPDTVVYRTSETTPNNVWIQPDVNPTFTRDVIIATEGQEFNRERQVQKTDSAETIAQKEMRSLKAFIWKIAALRYERSKIDPNRSRALSDNAAAENNLIFIQAERWGRMNSCLTPANVGKLPRPLKAPVESVRDFLDRPDVIEAIDAEKKFIAKKGGVNTDGIRESAAMDSEQIAMGACPTGFLRRESIIFREMRLAGMRR